MWPGKYLEREKVKMVRFTVADRRVRMVLCLELTQEW